MNDARVSHAAPPNPHAPLARSCPRRLVMLAPSCSISLPLPLFIFLRFLFHPCQAAFYVSATFTVLMPFCQVYTFEEVSAQSSSTRNFLSPHFSSMITRLLRFIILATYEATRASITSMRTPSRLEYTKHSL